MKKLQLLVYLILLLGVVMFFVNGNVHEQQALECAKYFNSNRITYNEQLYWKGYETINMSDDFIGYIKSLNPFWKEDGACCRFTIIDDMIKGDCQPKQEKEE